MTAQSKRPATAPVTLTPNQAGFDQLPDGAWLRQSELVRGAKTPLAPLPFSAPTLWRKVKDGTFPAPVKLSARVTAWQVGAVRGWLESIAEGKPLPQKAIGKVAA